MTRALVVDDSKAMCSILSRMLRDLGIESITAINGVDAIEKLEEHGAVDIALIDHNMPVMDGIALIHSLRGSRTYDRMKLMMVTGDSNPRTIVRALRSGADEYAMKPLDEDILKKKLRLLEIDIPNEHSKGN